MTAHHLPTAPHGTQEATAPDATAPPTAARGTGAATPRRSATSPISVTVVDDHTLVRDAACQLLAQEPGIEVVGQAASAEEALEQLERRATDVAIVDIALPGMSGLDLARVCAERFPDTAVLLVSAYDDYAYVARALDIGVGGYLLKTASARELVDATRAVADGVFVLDRGVSGRLARRWQRPSGAASAPGTLTPRERDVLALIARGLSNKRIATDLGLGLRTVEGYVSAVLAKLGVASRTEAALFAVAQQVPARGGQALRHAPGSPGGPGTDAP